MSEANRHAQSKDPLHCLRRPRPRQAFPPRPPAGTSSDKHGGPFTAGPPETFMWGRPPSAVRRAKLGCFAAHVYCPGNHHHRHPRSPSPAHSTIPGRAIHVDHLPRLRRHQSHAPRQHINALGIAQRSIFQPQRVIHLRLVAEFALRRLDLITVLNRLEMLPRISKDQQETDRPARCQTASSRDCGADLPLSPGGNCRSPWKNKSPESRSRTERCRAAVSFCPRTRTPACRRRCRHYAAPIEACPAKICSPCATGTCMRKNLIQFHVRRHDLLATHLFRPLHRRHQICDQCSRIHFRNLKFWIPTTEPVKPGVGLQLSGFGPSVSVC